jgi:2-keto-4-pentenoate hydratase
MDETALDVAVRLLSEAARTGVPIESLPEASRPVSAAEALAIQDRLVAETDKAVAGWKVATDDDGNVNYGTIYAEDCYPSPATVPVERYPLMGIEAEVAFRFLSDLPSGPALPRREIEGLLVPFPAFEIVATRFASYTGTPAVVRLADRMSNGGMIIGMADGSPDDLERIGLELAVDGITAARQKGGHMRGDPLLPVIEFINAQRPLRSFVTGQFITAGTYTGLRHGKVRERWHVRFEGLGEVMMTLA